LSTDARDGIAISFPIAYRSGMTLNLLEKKSSDLVEGEVVRVYAVALASCVDCGSLDDPVGAGPWCATCRRLVWAVRIGGRPFFVADDEEHDGVQMAERPLVDGAEMAVEQCDGCGHVDMTVRQATMDVACQACGTSFRLIRLPLRRVVL
jgi:hypothetical protein